MQDEKILRLIKWARGGRAPPFTLDINPTDRCNLRCLSCWQRSEKFKKINSDYELSEEKLLKIVKEAAELGVKEFEITGGGEPLMRRDVTLKMMEVIKNYKRFGNITTNGILFTKEDIERLVRIGWDRVTFSIDGSNAETNDYLRGKGSFNAMMKNISLFNLWKERLGSEKPVIKFNAVISNKNYNKLHEMIELAHKVNCEIVSFESLTVHSILGRKLKLSRKESKGLGNYIKRAEGLAKKYKIYTNASGFLKSDFVNKSNKMIDIIKNDGLTEIGLISSPCFEPWWHLVIKVDGSAQPCCLYDSKEANVNKKSLKQIWFGPFFDRIRDEMISRKFSNFCSICNAGQVMENRRIRDEFARVGS